MTLIGAPVWGDGSDSMAVPTSRLKVVHPNHFSTAEVRWNDKTGNFEVALCVYPLDLEKALTTLAGKAVDLDQKDGLDDLMKKYIESKFFIRKAKEIVETEPGAFKLSLGDRPVTAVTDAVSESPKKIDIEATENSQEALGKGHKHSSTLHPQPVEQGHPGSSHTDVSNSTNLPKVSTMATSQFEQPNLTNEQGEIRWVGFEANAKEAWLYFEILGDAKPAKWEIENRVFFEFNEEQVNQIRFTNGFQVRSFSLKHDRPKGRMDTFPPTKENRFPTLRFQ
jgi:hypothetical protein